MYGVQIAFKNFKPSLGIWASPWIGLSHFIRFVTYPDFIRMMRNTLSITLYSLATFPCAIILALLFNEVKNPGYKKTVQMATYAPHFLSTVVLCSLVIMLTGSTGPINSLRTALGATTPTNLLTMPSYFSTIYVWSGVWQNIGWGSIIYIAALAGVSPELIEAARIDGAGRLRIIWHVNIPGILPTIIITLIMSIGTLLTVGFEKIYLLQNSLNLDTSRVISTYTYEIGIIGGQFSYSAAIGLFNNIVNIAMIFIANIVSRRVSDVGLW
ncbi:sugar ABC transporter permease [Clostridia bacterium]|nr:sugar ABC transporter permease [Clostridia bacterium]